MEKRATNCYRPINMFDFLRNLGRSEEEKQQDALSAYLDGELAPAEQKRFEQELARNNELREELADIQQLQQQMRALPARRVPRNFTLEPTLYRRPQRQPLAAAYPVLCTATALAAFLFVIALAANVFLGSFPGNVAQDAESVTMMEQAAEEPAPVDMLRSEIEAEAEAPVESMVVEEPAVEEEIELARETIVVDLAEEALPAPGELQSSVDAIQGTPEPPMDDESVAVPAERTTTPLSAADGVDEALQPAIPEELGGQPVEEAAQLLPGAAAVEEAQEFQATVETAEQPAEDSVEPPADEEIIEEEPESGMTITPDEQQAPAVPAEMQRAVEIQARDRFPFFGGLGLVVLLLGLLFVTLTILTLLARERR